MKHCVRMNKQELPKTGKSRIPLVLVNVPLVDYKETQIIPFVCKKNPYNQFYGFTLIELMVTLAVVAILAMVAVPSMRTIIQNNRISTQVNNLLSDINLARSEAIRGPVNVQICTWNSTANPSNPACDGGNVWSGGRVICADRNNNGVFCEADELVRSREGLASMTLTPGAVINSITFDTRGLRLAAADVDFRLCDYRGTTSARLIKITRTGQASSSTAVLICP